MKITLIALTLSLITASAHAGCEKVITGSNYSWGMKENTYTIYCDGGAYQEDRGLTGAEASLRVEKRQMQEDYDKGPEAQARAAAINAEIEKERQMSLVHVPISQ